MYRVPRTKCHDESTKRLLQNFCIRDERAIDIEEVENEERRFSSMRFGRLAVGVDVIVLTVGEYRNAADLQQSI